MMNLIATLFSRLFTTLFGLYSVINLGQGFVKLFSWILNGMNDVSGTSFLAFNQTYLLILLGISVALTLLWHLCERKSYLNESRSKTIYHSLYLAVVYYLCYVFLSYAFSKLYGAQFYPLPTLWHDYTLGELANNGFVFVWSFFGSSYIYVVFIALGQVAGAITLTFRRTRILGCMILLMITANIVMINYAYNIFVLPYSIHLFVMIIYVFLHDGKRIMHFFLNNATQLPSIWGKSNRQREFHLGWFWIIVSISMTSYFTYLNLNDEYYRAVPNELVGIWETETFSTSQIGESETAIVNADWNKLVFSAFFNGQLGEVNIAEEKRSIKYEMDPIQHSLSFSLQSADSLAFDGVYRIEDNILFLEGVSVNDSVFWKLVKKNYANIRQPSNWESILIR